MSISGIGISDHSTSWRKRKTQNNISNTNFAIHMAGANIINVNERASAIASGNGTVTGMTSGRDTYVNGASSICTVGVYSKESISATQELDLLIETERYKIEDASFLDGVAAYSITDKETGRSLYMREDQLVIQRDEVCSSRTIAGLYALMEISGNLKREKEGMTYLTPNGISYIPYDGKNKDKAWHIILPNSDYSAARKYLATGIEASNDKIWLSKFQMPNC